MSRPNLAVFCDCFRNRLLINIDCSPQKTVYSLIDNKLCLTY